MGTLRGLLRVSPLLSLHVCLLVSIYPLLDLQSGFLWSSRLPEQHRFSIRPIVLPIFYVCYLQHWIRFYVVRTEISLAFPCRVHRHTLFSAISVYLMGHTAAQSSVREGFCLNRQKCLHSHLRWLTRSPNCSSCSVQVVFLRVSVRPVVDCIRPSRSDTNSASVYGDTASAVMCLMSGSPEEPVPSLGRLLFRVFTVLRTAVISGFVCSIPRATDIPQSRVRCLGHLRSTRKFNYSWRWLTSCFCIQRHAFFNSGYMPRLQQRTT